jgi:hypothetical protein
MPLACGWLAGRPALRPVQILFSVRREQQSVLFSDVISYHSQYWVVLRAQAEKKLGAARIYK